MLGGVGQDQGDFLAIINRQDKRQLTPLHLANRQKTLEHDWRIGTEFKKKFRT